jgi:hypothetical protein
MSDRGNVLRLIYAKNPRNPKRTLDLAGTTNSDNIFLTTGGLSANAGRKNVQYQDMSIFKDGATRTDMANRANMEFSITYDLLLGGSTAELAELQREIDEFIKWTDIENQREGDNSIWLEYRWVDDLSSLPAPRFGQLSTYLRILDIETVQGSRIQSGSLRVGCIENVVANIVADPYPVGLPQRAMNVQGFYTLARPGIFIGSGFTQANMFANSSFEQGATGWTAGGGDLDVIVEQRDGYIYSFGNSIRLINKASVTQINFVRSVNLTIGTTYFISGKVRLPDGSAPTINDVKFLGDDTIIVSPNFQQIYDGPWYLAYGTFTSTKTASSANGVLTEPRRTITVDDMQLHEQGIGNTTYPRPYISSTTATTSGRMIEPFTTEMADHFSVMFWFTPLWDYPQGEVGGSDNRSELFNYWFDNNNFVRAYFNESSGYTIQKSVLVGGVPQAFSFSYNPGALTYGVPIHVAVIDDNFFIELYINGQLVASSSPANSRGMPANGDFTLGYFADVHNYSADSIFDAPRVFDIALTGTQVLTFYNNEVNIKNRHEKIGIPPFIADLFVGSTDYGKVEQDFSTGGEPYVIMSCNGDVPATVRWEIELPPVSPSRVYFLGRKVLNIGDNITIFDANMFFNYLNDAQTILDGNDYTFTNTMDDPTSVGFNVPTRGHWNFLATFVVANNSININPFYRLGSSSNREGNSNVIPITVTTEKLFWFGDWDQTIDWLKERTPNSITTGMIARNDSGGNSNVTLKTLIALATPSIRVEVSTPSMPSLTAGDRLVIETDRTGNKQSYIIDDSDNDNELARFETVGEIVTVVPNQYNLVQLIQGESGEEFDEGLSAKIIAIVTPRFLTPGGPIA